ncbi:MAG: TauD/TfdA family dioxygenase [Rhodobacteraceae bacterium]|nr:TauD/TfdA family dioxygenase [Paracoccaceae bacterium]
MTQTFVTPTGDALAVTWPDGTTAEYPSIWLRDNCPSGFHADTRERVADLLALPDTPRIRAAGLNAGAVHIDWADKGQHSRFPLDWLKHHSPGRIAPDAAALPPQIWRGDLGARGIPRAAHSTVQGSDTALADWLTQTVRYGISIIGGLPDSRDAGMDAARRVGFLRETNFGIEFEVISKPDPNNLAYTALALPLHTDLANQELPPGFQFLHCIANAARGGGSIFADGFAIARDLREDHPEAFTLLAKTPVPFWFHDDDTDLRVHRSVITLDSHGAVQEIKWNAHLAGVFDMPADRMPAYYRAYRAFMAKTRDPAYQIRLKLNAGEMVVFDNRRVLHGRDAFDPATGFRHLRGCYVDRGEVQSRLRVLRRGADGLGAKGAHVPPF